jgi:DNA-binding CsgD family transcriptional regulator
MRPALRSEEIYDALVCDDSLANLPQRLAETVDARSSWIRFQHGDDPPELLSNSFFDQKFHSDYHAHWTDKSSWLKEYSKPKHNNRLSSLHNYVPEESFAKSAIYNEFLKPDWDNTFHCAGLKVVAPGFVGYYSCHRGRSAGAFEEEDIAPLRPRVEDLSRLMRLRGELTAARRREAEAKSAMDGLALAIFSVRRDGYCRDLNAAASAVVLRGDGLTLRRDRLTTVAADAAEPLRAAIERATARQDPQTTSVTVPRPPPFRPYLVTVSPHRIGTGVSLAMIVVRDPETATRSATDRLRPMFGLSPAEASLAASLADGMTPDEMADARRVSLNTIRSQLRAVSEKMGCNRLAQVAAIVASLPPT